MNEEIQQAISEEDYKESAMENVTFRLSGKERKLLFQLQERLNKQASAVIRIALRALEKQTRVE